MQHEKSRLKRTNLKINEQHTKNTKKRNQNTERKKQNYKMLRKNVNQNNTLSETREREKARATRKYTLTHTWQKAIKNHIMEKNLHFA